MWLPQPGRAALLFRAQDILAPFHQRHAVLKDRALLAPLAAEQLKGRRLFYPVARIMNAVGNT